MSLNLRKPTVTVRLHHARSVTVPRSLSPGVTASARMKPSDLVKLRFCLWLVPIRPGRDVFQLRFEEVVQEFFFGVLHLREDFARGRRADAVYGVRVDRPLPVDCHEVRDLLGTGEELPLFFGQIELSAPLSISISHGPRGPSKDR